MANIESDEYLEHLWSMAESGTDAESVDELASRVHIRFDIGVLKLMREKNLLELREGDTRVAMTPEGKEYARQLVRQHRLAERLIHDMLGVKSEQFENAACEFEHVVAPELVDSICILLGHPRECPHGKPIPRGKCCEKNLRLIECAPLPLTSLKTSDQGRVAFVRCDRDDQMHRLDGLHIRPGAEIKLHQTFPTYVIECEGALVALEEKIAAQIHVWPSGGNPDK